MKDLKDLVVALDQVSVNIAATQDSLVQANKVACVTSNLAQILVMDLLEVVVQLKRQINLVYQAAANDKQGITNDDLTQPSDE